MMDSFKLHLIRSEFIKIPESSGFAQRQRLLQVSLGDGCDNPL